MSEYYHYYVEGEDDEKVVNTLKTNLQWIVAGKVEKFNVVESLLTTKNLMRLKNKRRGTTVILVFDTDTGKTDTLERNIKFLKAQSIIKDVVCVPQVYNLEDELIRSCAIKKISELTNSKSDSDYKRDILRIGNLERRLKDCKFDFLKFWVMQPQNEYVNIPNDSNKIKIHR